MNDLETRIRRARPPGPHRADPLTERARSELQELMTEAPAQPVPSPRRWLPTISWLLVATGALVAAAVAVLTISWRPGNDIGMPEDDTRTTAAATAPRFGSIANLAGASEFVSQVTVLSSTAQETPERRRMIVSEVRVETSLLGSAQPGEVIRVTQPEGESGNSGVELQAIDGDSLVLFLTASEGSYALTSPTQGVLAVNGDEVISVFDDPLFAQINNLEELLNAGGR